MIEQKFQNQLLTVINNCNFDSLPEPNFIISFDKEGNPLSRYKDNEWDLMCYAYKKQSSSRVIFQLDNNSENAKILIEHLNVVTQLSEIADMTGIMSAKQEDSKLKKLETKN